MTTLPRLGAALYYDGVNELRDWLFDHDRALEIQDFCTFDSLKNGTEEKISAYKSLLDGYKGDIGTHGPFFGLDLSNPDKEIREVIIKRLLEGLEVAEQLGGTHMVVHSPFTFWHSLNMSNYAFLRPALFEAAAECLAPVIKRAEEIGCMLVLENIDDADPSLRRDLVTQMDSPMFRLSIDTGHAQLANGQYKAPPVVDFIADAGELLKHVHLQDADGYADRHWHPGEGTLPWGPIFSAIKHGGGNPRLLLEVRHEPERLPQTVKRLEERGLAC